MLKAGFSKSFFRSGAAYKQILALLSLLLFSVHSLFARDLYCDNKSCAHHAKGNIGVTKKEVKKPCKHHAYQADQKQGSHDTGNQKVEKLTAKSWGNTGICLCGHSAQVLLSADLANKPCKQTSQTSLKAGLFFKTTEISSSRFRPLEIPLPLSNSPPIFLIQEKS